VVPDCYIASRQTKRIPGYRRQLVVSDTRGHTMAFLEMGYALFSSPRSNRVSMCVTIASGEFRISTSIASPITWFEEVAAVQEMARLTWYFVDGCDIARVPQPRSRTASRAPTADPRQCSSVPSLASIDDRRGP
jgi:hypothetical protein